MNILIFGTASNTRSPDQQGQAELFLQLKHKVFLLTLGKDDILHRNFRALGAEAYSSAHKTGRSVLLFIRQAIFFAEKYCVSGLWLGILTITMFSLTIIVGCWILYKYGWISLMELSILQLILNLFVITYIVKIKNIKKLLIRK